MQQSSSALIIGYGRMGKEHERAYQECGVNKFHYADKYNWQETVRHAPARSYVSVCSYDDAHAEQILYALERGHKVIAEKPLCLTGADLEKIYRASDAQNLFCNLPLLEKEWPKGCSGAAYLRYQWGRFDRLPGWRGQIPNYSFVLGAGVHIASLALHIKGRAIEHISATGIKTHPDMPCETGVTSGGVFVGGDTVALDIDCTSTAAHEHYVQYNADGMHFEILNTTTDKTKGIKAFIERGYSTTHQNAFAAHSVCFAIERALKSGKRETVEYLA